MPMTSKVLFLLFVHIALYGQISTRLDVIKPVEIESIEELSISYTNGNSVMEKCMKVDSSGRLSSYQIYKNQLLLDSVEYVYSRGKLKKIYKYVSKRIYHYGYDNWGNRVSEIVTNDKDSLIHIYATEYNENNEVIFNRFHITPGWMKRSMPDFEKDSISYDYEKQMKYRCALAYDGSTYQECDEEKIDNAKESLISEKFRFEFIYDYKSNWIEKKKIRNSDSVLVSLTK